MFINIFLPFLCLSHHAHKPPTMDGDVQAPTTMSRTACYTIAKLLFICLFIYLSFQTLLISVSLCTDPLEEDETSEETVLSSNDWMYQLFHVSTSKFIFYLICINILRVCSILAWIGTLWEWMWVWVLMWTWVPVLLETFLTAVLFVLTFSFTLVVTEPVQSWTAQQAIFVISQTVWFVILSVVIVSFFCLVGRR